MPTEFYSSDIPNFIKTLSNYINKIKELKQQKKREKEYRILNKVYRKEREKLLKEFSTTEI
jgi:cell shape-determining protein MreC